MKLKNVIIPLSLLSLANSIKPTSKFIHTHPALGTKSIIFLTHKLPTIDTLGHKNLELNDKLIPWIMNYSHLSSFIKAEIVTSLIHFSQLGDNFGSWILKYYLSIITYIVNSI